MPQVLLHPNPDPVDVGVFEGVNHLAQKEPVPLVDAHGRADRQRLWENEAQPAPRQVCCASDDGISRWFSQHRNPDILLDGDTSLAPSFFHDWTYRERRAKYEWIARFGTSSAGGPGVVRVRPWGLTYARSLGECSDNRTFRELGRINAIGASGRASPQPALLPFLQDCGSDSQSVHTAERQHRAREPSARSAPRINRIFFGTRPTLWVGLLARNWS